MKLYVHLVSILVLLGFVAFFLQNNYVEVYGQQQQQQQKQVTLTAIVAEPKERWDILFEKALDKLRQNHPELDIQIDYRVLPYDATRTQILTSMAGQTPLDLISVDHDVDLAVRARVKNRVARVRGSAFGARRSIMDG